MIQANVPILLEKGIYTPKQAARYARLHTQTLSRWIHGDARGDAAVRAELQCDGDRFVTFLDFVQAMAIRSIRRERKVPLSKIRDLVERAKFDYGIEYPLARRHVTYLFDDDIAIRVGEQFIQLTGSFKDNQLMREVVELYAVDLSYEPDKPYPTQYRPFRYGERSVVLDPTRRFGEPIVESCGMAVSTLMNAVASEGSVSAAADAYEVDPEDVFAALRFDDWLTGPTA